MIPTRKLNIGDLVYANGELGMIISYDERAYTLFQIQWFDVKATEENWNWRNTQEMRNNYLAYRNNMK